MEFCGPIGAKIERDLKLFLFRVQARNFAPFLSSNFFLLRNECAVNHVDKLLFYLPPSLFVLFVPPSRAALSGPVRSPLQNNPNVERFFFNSLSFPARDP